MFQTNSCDNEYAASDGGPVQDEDEAVQGQAPETETVRGQRAAPLRLHVGSQSLRNVDHNLYPIMTECKWFK